MRRLAAVARWLLDVDLPARRVRVLGGHRLHHGPVGLAIMLHDARDCRRWLSDFLHEPRRPPARITYYGRGRPR